MITEKGTVKTSVELNENLYNDLNKNLRNLGILYIVCGVIIFIFGLLLLGINVYEGTEDWSEYVMVVVGAVFVFLGVFFQLLYRNAIKAALKIKRVSEVEFFNGYLIEKEYTDGEHTASNKVYYNWIVRKRETKNYLFLYNTRVTAVAVDKNSLTPDELNTIRALLGKAPQASPAPAKEVQNRDNPAASDAPPPEPFEETKDNSD